MVMQVGQQAGHQLVTARGPPVPAHGAPEPPWPPAPSHQSDGPGALWGLLAPISLPMGPVLGTCPQVP